MRLRLTREAKSDLDDIWYYIALDSAESGDRTISGVLRGLDTLRIFASAGTPRNELSLGLRSWSIENYLAFYTVAVDEIKTIRILDGRLNLRNISFTA